MPRTPDSFVDYDELLANAPLTNPWLGDAFIPDDALLSSLVTVPVASGVDTTSGRFPKAFDAWVAHHLRRAGFQESEVWPRATRPRILPRDIAALLSKYVPASHRAAISDFLIEHTASASITPVDARVLGRVYTKQADVLIASWPRGVELMVSTKTMMSSYGNNLRNRFEESYGDADNVRGRFPLASLGFLFAVRADIPDKDHVFLVDMLQKLREPRGYDACCLLVVDWDDDGIVRLDPDSMPEPLGPARFFKDLVAAVLNRTPVDHHVEVRSRHLHAPLPLDEGELTDEGSDT